MERRDGPGRGPKNWPVRSKMGLAFGIVLALFAFSCGLFFFGQQRVASDRAWTAHTYEMIVAGDALERLIREQRQIVRVRVLAEDPTLDDDYDAVASRFDDALAALLRDVSDNPLQVARLDRVKRWVDEFRVKQAEPVVRAKTAGELAELRLAVAAGERTGGGATRAIEAAMDEIEAFRATEWDLLAQREAALKASHRLLSWGVAGMFFVGVLVVLLALRMTARLIAGPLVALSRQTQQLARGELDIEVRYRDQDDEIGRIAQALDVFQRAAREVAVREWVKSRLAEVNATLGGHSRIETLADAVLARLCPMIGVPHAAIFCQTEDRQALKLRGGFGLADRADDAPPRRLDEGLLGQCARERKLVVVDEVPDGYVRVQSGLGSAVPSLLYLWPLTTSNGLVGVIELASFAPLKPQHLDLVEESRILLALAIEALESMLRTQQLLEETQTQAEELHASQEALRTQREELRSSNEALRENNAMLEEQSQKLQASDEELRVQQEELQASNEELEEKSRTLSEFNDRLRKIQGELERRNLELEDASRYKSEFLANMSHELRTPLNSLLILAKSLADNEDGNLTEEQIESARIVFESGGNLLQLINDILDLSKIEAGKTEVAAEVIGLPAFAAGIEREFRALARQRQLGFAIELAEGVPEQVYTDGGKLRQILVNLIGNAFKFTQQGSVCVRFEAASPGVVLGDRKALLRISIADSGIGIPADKLSRIFEAFEQADSSTSRKYGGTGLGLSIVRGLARLLGGEISVASREGEGSTFTLSLPESPPDAATRPVEAASRPPAPLAAPVATAPEAFAARVSAAPGLPTPVLEDDRDGIEAGDTVILAVEDDLSFLRVLINRTRKKGFKVLAADDGPSAIALAERFRPTGILLDLALPGMSGLEVIERLKSTLATRAIPIHVISAGEASTPSLAAGAVGFLQKPVSKASLDEAFERVMHFAGDDPRKLLIVDDDDASRAALRTVLAGGNIEISEATTAGDGLKALRDRRFDCLILDLGLPDGSGFELLEEAARAGPIPPVIVYSARDLTREENLKLHEYTDSIVIKGARSTERLLDEVTLFLHAVRRQAASTAVSERPTDLAGRTVLLVDDDMRNVFALSKALRSRGLKVVVAQDGFKALAQIEQQPVLDLVLMDIMMPGMDGYQTMRRIRQRPEWRELPIIALTAKAMRGDREKCLEAGANDYLSKPIDVERLVSMMHVWIDSRPRSPLG